MSLTFSKLRIANQRRLPFFKNKHGHLAHSKPDGSDWTPAQWLQATMGELGEFAEARIAFEDGKVSIEKYAEMASGEIADFTIYSDILAQRALDITSESEGDDGRLLMHIIAAIGNYANARKKYDRGDFDAKEFTRVKLDHLNDALWYLNILMAASLEADVKQTVIDANPFGVNLGAAVTQKFNEVSERVGCDVFIVGTMV